MSIVMTNPPRLARQSSEEFAGAGLATVRRAQGVQFPAWPQAVSAQGIFKVTSGSLNPPIVRAGEIVRPGDLILADADGVVVAPAATAAATPPGAPDQGRRRPRTALGRRIGARPRRSARKVLQGVCPTGVEG